MTITYDPRTTHGYRAPWRVDAPWLSAPANARGGEV